MARIAKVTVRFTSWTPGPVIEDAAKEAERRVEKACMLVETTAIQKVSRGQPVRRSGTRLVGLDPSRPGEPPKVVTARLRQSIGHHVERRGNLIVGEVGTNVEYAPYLEFGTEKMAPRPWLRPSLIENESEIANIFGAE